MDSSLHSSWVIQSISATRNPAEETTVNRLTVQMSLVAVALTTNTCLFYLRTHLAHVLPILLYMELIVATALLRRTQTLLCINNVSHLIQAPFLVTK